MPTLWDAQMHGTDNPFIAFFSSIDIVFVFEVILSLMGLIFAYDAIAGERERGTLRLVLRTTCRTWADLTCEIYQCNDVSVGASDIKSTFCPTVANAFRCRFQLLIFSESLGLFLHRLRTYPYFTSSDC